MAPGLFQYSPRRAHTRWGCLCRCIPGRHPVGVRRRWNMTGRGMHMPTSVAKAERVINIALISKAAMDLARTHERGGLSEVDIVNRAITLYDFVDDELASGAQLLLRRANGSTYRVELR
jgi:hypothetical protein